MLGVLLSLVLLLSLVVLEVLLSLVLLLSLVVLEVLLSLVLLLSLVVLEVLLSLVLLVSLVVLGVLLSLVLLVSLVVLEVLLSLVLLVVSVDFSTNRSNAVFMVCVNWLIRFCASAGVLKPPSVGSNNSSSDQASSCCNCLELPSPVVVSIKASCMACQESVVYTDSSNLWTLASSVSASARSSVISAFLTNTFIADCKLLVN